MADAGALRGPAVAGHAGAIVEYVGDIQLHIAVHPRESASEQRPELPERSTSRSNLSLSLTLSLSISLSRTLLRKECKRERVRR